jgi:ADP-heptose:LPS heptosyltransferase
VAALGVPVPSRDLELRIPTEAAAGVARLLSRAGIAPDGPYLVLAPGASCAARRFDAPRFAAAATEIGGLTGWPILVVGAERDEAEARPILDALPQARPLIGLTSVPELAAVIGGARLLLGTDSAPMHIADAFGVPQVIAFAGTDLASQWAPRRSPARLLTRPTDCAPCGLFSCPYAHQCLDLQPADLVAAAAEVLGLDPDAYQRADRQATQRRLAPGRRGADATRPVAA